jgi:DNA invertase Pin-like site-specific DNA recombinase
VRGWSSRSWTRLSRDAHFLLGLEKAGVDFIAADMPHANRLTVGIMAMVADQERRMISQRTKAALAATKKRGTKLGGYRGTKLSKAARIAGCEAQAKQANDRAADLAPLIAELREAGLTSCRAIAQALNGGGVPTARGRVAAWTGDAAVATAVRRCSCVLSSVIFDGLAGAPTGSMRPELTR